MRSIDPVLKERLLAMQQTLYQNAQPSMEVQVIRPRTPIFHKRFWQESIVAENTTAQSTSVAIRNTGSRADRAYVAYVSEGTLTVKSAVLAYPVVQMGWEVVLTIPDCAACALEFDGRFVPASLGKVEYLTEELPWLFYTTTSGQLMAGILGGPYESLVGANVTGVDAIRGIASRYGDIDQGLLVFYLLNGNVYCNSRVAGLWEGQQLVSLAPANAVSIRAERVFDWRIVLQVTDNTGALYEVFSMMEASSWNAQTYLATRLTISSELISVTYLGTYHEAFLSADLQVSSILLYGLPPEMVAARNIDNGSGDYGYLVEVDFDEAIFGETGNEGSFVLQDEDENEWAAVSIARTDRTLTLDFDNFNNAVGTCSVVYTPGTLIGEVEPVMAHSVSFLPTGLFPFYVPPPVVVSLENLAIWEDV